MERGPPKLLPNSKCKSRAQFATQTTAADKAPLCGLAFWAGAMESFTASAVVTASGLKVLIMTRGLSLALIQVARTHSPKLPDSLSGSLIW